MNDLVKWLREVAVEMRVVGMARCDEAADHIEELEEALLSAIDFIDRYVDVIDGPDGIPVPNYAMALNTFLNEVLEGKNG